MGFQACQFMEPLKTGTRVMRVEDIVGFCMMMRSACVRAKHETESKQHEGDPLGRRGELASGQWRVNTLCLPCCKAGFCRR